MKAKQYRKKPVVIKAVVWNGNNHGELRQFTGDRYEHNTINFRNGGLTVNTLEGAMHAAPGDYIIKGVKGEFYPCKPDIFEATYELVES